MTPLRAVPVWTGAEPASLTVPEAIALAVPLCFLVEPDPLWGDRAVDALLEQHAADAPPQARLRERMVARWTRTRRWFSYTPYVFGLGTEGPLSGGDVLEEVVRLSDHLGSARRGDGPHPFQAALFSMRGLQADLSRSHASDVLLDVVRQLTECRATLLVELDSTPAPESPITRLGPVVRLSADSALRYEHAVAELAGLLPPASDESQRNREIEGALNGLSRLQAEIVARMVSAAAGPSGRAGNLLQLLAAARARVEAAMPGAIG